MDDLFIYWTKYPPAHVLVAAYLLKGNDKPLSNTGREMQAANMSAAIHSVGGTHRGKLPDCYRNC